MSLCGCGVGCNGREWGAVGCNGVGCNGAMWGAMDLRTVWPVE